jgi:hypothetical protein
MERRHFITGIVALFATRALPEPKRLYDAPRPTEPDTSTLLPGQMALYDINGREISGAGYKRATRWTEPAKGHRPAMVDFGTALSDWGTVAFVALKPTDMPSVIVALLEQTATVMRNHGFKVHCQLF